jgi:hypothetical protein
LVIGVLEMAVRAGCVDACLDTRTDRLAAIALYMGLGFEPLLAGDEERGWVVSGSHEVSREVWEGVLADLREQAG